MSMTLGEILQTLRGALEGNNDNKVNRCLTILSDLFEGFEHQDADDVILDDLWADPATGL